MNTDEPSAADDAIIQEVTRYCLLSRTRRISRVITSIYDQELRHLGLNSPQFSLLVVISRLGSASRAEIGRANQQDRSTLTRNLALMLSEGWVEEMSHAAGGRNKAIVLTKAGRQLLQDAAPAWRKGQEKAKKLLGPKGATAIVDVADGL